MAPVEFLTKVTSPLKASPPEAFAVRTLPVPLLIKVKSPKVFPPSQSLFDVPVRVMVVDVPGLVLKLFPPATVKAIPAPELKMLLSGNAFAVDIVIPPVPVVKVLFPPIVLLVLINMVVAASNVFVLEPPNRFPVETVKLEPAVKLLVPPKLLFVDILRVVPEVKSLIPAKVLLLVILNEVEALKVSLPGKVLLFKIFKAAAEIKVSSPENMLAF